MKKIRLKSCFYICRALLVIRAHDFKSVHCRLDQFAHQKIYRIGTLRSLVLPSSKEFLTNDIDLHEINMKAQADIYLHFSKMR